MDKEIKTNNKIKTKNIVFVFVLFLFLIIIAKLCYLCLVDYQVGEITISDFITNRNIKEEIVMPIRGSIYDNKGNILAQDVVSYTVIAYLKKSSKNHEYVSDIEITAEKLAPLIKMKKEDLVLLLSKDVYQVELGPGGRNLSQLEMEAIKELELPGIDFVKDTKRYYSNGDFASYLLGYTVTEEDENGNNWIRGELGIEEYYNETLKGKTGFITYEKDRKGNKIANGREYIEEADDGDNIYLTIDSNIELFVESAVKKMQTDSEAEWSFMIVADAKTGAILGYSSTPSFDPNIRNMTSYLDPLVSYAYEPGSTMKIFSYMCAIESGNYNGEDTYLSGSKTYESEIDGDAVTINDWNKKGWGTISYDQGFALSSNIAVANLVESVINKNDLSACYSKYGFGQTTGFTLSRELKGSIDFKYQVEVATAGYGQGITITPVQYIQALTALANNGTMLKPYVVDKIIDSNNNETIMNSKVTKLDTIASTNTINKIKELMRNVINPDSTIATGAAYYMDGYDLIGKTGTAQLFDYESGQYLTGWTDYIYSFAGLYPGEDPEIIIYAALQKPKDTTNYIATAVKDVLVNVSKYLNIKEKTPAPSSYKLSSYINKNTESTKKLLEENNLKVIVLGTGSKITNHYPLSGSALYKDDLVILLTNNYNKEMIDLVNLSYKEAINVLKLMNVNYTLEGKGYVYEQSIIPGTIIDANSNLIVKLKEKYDNS